MLKKYVCVVLCLSFIFGHIGISFAATYHIEDVEHGPGVAPVISTKWERDDKGWYCQHKDGNYLYNEWLEYEDNWYYFNSEGYMVTGWQIIDGVVYYFSPDVESEGMMLRDTSINGVPVLSDGKVDSDGVYEMAIPVLNEIGWDLEAAYNWVRTFPYVRRNTSPDLGHTWFAKHGFENRSGNCYVAAATFATLAKLIGYEARTMYGWVPARRGGITPHGWTEIIINGETRVFDVNYHIETGKNGYNINYGQAGTWRYQNYAPMQ